MIFVDTNVLIDVLTSDQDWKDWSRAKLQQFGARGDNLVVNTVVLAELAGNFPDLAAACRALDSLDIEVLPLFDEVAFLAGQAFRRYRHEHRGRGAILADFLIAGHAASLGATLLTRDRGSFTSYFPDLTLITPENDDG